MKPLIGSSELCQQYLNNLMCYICAPNQFKFYGHERLTVCIEFCDQMYSACANAILKGSRINEIYLNGEGFCKSRRFNIGELEKDKCFYYEIQPFLSKSTKLSIDQFKFFLYLIVFHFIL
jgi:hypothetical protein